jgi:hypothetical protein
VPCVILLHRVTLTALSPGGGWGGLHLDVNTAEEAILDTQPIERPLVTIAGEPVLLGTPQPPPPTEQELAVPLPVTIEPLSVLLEEEVAAPPATDPALIVAAVSLIGLLALVVFGIVRRLACRHPAT